jgi:hypothetical protein
VTDVGRQRANRKPVLGTEPDGVYILDHLHRDVADVYILLGPMQTWAEVHNTNGVALDEVIEAAHRLGLPVFRLRSDMRRSLPYRFEQVEP